MQSTPTPNTHNPHLDPGPTQARAEAMQSRAQAAARAEVMQVALVTKEDDTPKAMAKCGPTQNLP